MVKKLTTNYKNVCILLFFGMIVGCSTFSGVKVMPVIPLPTLPDLSPTHTPLDSLPTSTHTPLPEFTPTHTVQVATTTTITPTRTALSTATEIVTATATNTVISTATATFTPGPSELTLLQDCACLTGAGFGYSISHYVSSGSSYPLLGQLQDRSWWLVGVEEDQTCWIYNEFAQVNGMVDSLPVMTLQPLPTQTSTPPPASSGVYYILISADTGGPFGCGDTLIKYFPGVWVKGDMEDDILAALNALFANHNQYVGGLYNPIYQSSLKAKSVEWVGNDLVVQLNGTFVRPKDTCESQRMHDQVWYTVSQFSPVRAVIYLNNALLGDLLVVAKK
jgi:hypothetical protein